MSFSPEQQQLLSVLLATQQPETIKAAEAQLAKYAAEYQGYALLMMSLLQPALAEAIGKDTQTAIAVNLKRYVLTHWCTSVPTFTPPQVPDSEKAEVHRHILSLLATPYSGVRRQLSQTINEIAESDFPEKWNNLLPDVLAILHQAAQAGHDATPAQTNLLVGTLGSLSDFTAQMEDHQLVTTIPTLFPALLELCQKKFEVIMQVQRASPLPALDAAQQQAVKDALQVCTFAIKVYESCCQSINMMNISANDDARQRGKKKATDLNKVLNEFLIPSLPTWWGFFTTILTMPAGSGVFDFAHAFPTSWGLRLEAVKCLTNLSERFGADILARGVDGAAMYERALATLMDGLTNAYPMYEKTVLNTDDDASEEEERDEDDNPISMSVFVFDTFGHFRSVLSMRPPPKMKPTKGKATKPTLAAQINAAKHAGYDHIKGLFGPANNFLQRLLQLSLQYGQLSSREVAASLSDMVEYLSSSAPSSHSDGDDGIGSSVNARLGVKDLFMDCILWHAGAEKDEDVDELEAMGYMGMGGPDGDGAGSVMIDRRYVLQVLCPLLTELLKHSLSLRESDANWWKGRELATLLVGYIVGDIIEAQAAASASPQPKTKGGKKQEQQQQQVQPPSFDLQSFIRDILMPDLSFTNASRRNHALLRAQTLTSTARFAPVFLKAQEKNLVVLALEEIVRNMQPESEAAPTTLLTRIAAVDAFGTLCGEIDKELLMHNNILHGALTNICQLIHSAAQRDVDGPEVDEPSLVKVIQTLIMAISVNQQVTIAAEPTLTPLLLSAWSANATVPFIADGVTDALEQLLEVCPETCVSVQTKVLPVLAEIFKQYQQDVAVSGTAGAALSLVQHVLLSIEKHTRAIKEAQGKQGSVTSPGKESSAAPELIHPALFSDLLPITLQMVLLNTDDHDLIEVSTHVLTAYLRIDSAKVAAINMPIILAPGTQPTQMNGVQILCAIINLFLQPSMDDKVAHNCGTLIVQVVLSFGSILGEANIRELIKGVVVRLHSSLYPPLDQSLILVFARLIHSSSVEMVLGIVAGLGRIQAQQKELERIKQKATDQYASFSRTVLKPVEVDALPYLISKWITTLSDRMARYSSKILHLALIKLMTYIFTPSAPGSDMLRNLECQGYIIPAKPEPKKRPHTRQTTAASGNSSSHEPSYTRIPLSTKLLSMFLKEWSDWSARHAVQMKAKARKARRLAREAGEDVPEEEEEDEEDEYFEDDEDGEFDDDDDDEDDSEWIKQMHGKMSGGAGKSPFAAAEDFQDMGRGALAGNSKLMTLSDLLDAHDEFQFDGETEEELHPESLTDPLNEIQLGPYVQSFVKEFGQAQNGAMLHEAGRYLDQKDQEMLQALMNAQQPATPQK